MSDWILLRGLTRETRHWGAFESALRAQSVIGADERAVFIDLAGNGAEREHAAPLSVHAMMERVRERVLSLDLPMPCRILAMSLGAMVATAWAERHPNDIERLVLINTSMRPFARFDERLRPRAWPVLAQIAMNWTRPERCERMVHRLTCNRKDTETADIADWAALRATRGSSAINALRQLAAAARFRAAQEAPRCPVLLLSSTADGLVDPVCSQRLADAWHAAHAVHPWAGHDLPHDDAPWTGRTIAQWLRQTQSAVDVSFTA